MTTSTVPVTAIKAAMGVARELAEGQLAPGQLATVAADECRELFSHVVGPDDALWSLQCDVARQVLAAGGVPAGELAEWLAVAHTRAGEAVAGSEVDVAGSGAWIEPLLAQLADEDAPDEDVSKL